MVPFATIVDGKNKLTLSQQVERTTAELVTEATMVLLSHINT